MDSKRLQYLQECYRRSSCTKEELAELNQWYDKLNEGENKIEDWIVEAGGEDELADQLYQNFTAKTASRSHKFRRTIQWLSAAAAVIIIATGILFYRSGMEHPAKNLEVAGEVISPGSKRAVLTLSDGTQINLDNSADGLIYNQNGISIIKTDSGSLVYQTNHSSQNVSDAQMQFNSLYVPRGGQYKVTLPDGTQVWVNSASTLRFPVTANGTDREVFLTGEGYFEVVHNKQLPFKVRTADQEVRVLGTHFNIKAYTEEPSISTTLLEGSVKISKRSGSESKLLLPGQQANTSQQIKGIDITAVNTKQAVAWKNGYFIFDNEDIRSVLTALSRWYDIDVAYVGEISSERFGGTFSRNTNLSEILDNLQELGDIRFTINKRKVIVSTGTRNL